MRVNTCLPVVMYEPSLPCLADRNLYLSWPESTCSSLEPQGHPQKKQLSYRLAYEIQNVCSSLLSPNLKLLFSISVPDILLLRISTRNQRRK